MESMKGKMLKRFNHDKNSEDKRLIPPLPKSLNIEVTSACNHNCFFCSYHSNLLDRKVESKFMDPSLARRILVEAAEVGIGSAEVGFHMTGEPLLCKEFAEYVKLAKDLGFPYVFTTTNGVLATPSNIEQYLEAGLDSIRFSVNGATAESYRIAHGKDDFDLVLEHIKYLDDYRKRTGNPIRVSLSTVITKQNKGEMTLIEEVFRPLVDEIAFIPVLSLDRFFPDLDQEYSLPREDADFEFTPCATAFNSMYISCEGYVVPCCAAIRSGELVMADLKDGTTLTEAWEGERFVKLREAFLKETIPSEFCSGCIALNKNTKMVL